MSTITIDLLRSIPTVEKHRLATGNPDWDVIPIALADTTVALLTEFSAGRVDSGANALRCIAETIYAMGYRRGKCEAAMPTFVVAPPPQREVEP